jgi:hypothetical protein
LDEPYERLYRAIPGSAPSKEDFLSRSAKKLPCPANVDPCRNASCSFFDNEEKATKLLSLPNFQNGMVVCLRIPSGKGQSLKKKQHVDFWAYASCDFIQLIRND